MSLLSLDEPSFSHYGGNARLQLGSVFTDTSYQPHSLHGAITTAVYIDDVPWKTEIPLRTTPVDLKDAFCLGTFIVWDCNQVYMYLTQHRS
jgi:hypothetical protein